MLIENNVPLPKFTKRSKYPYPQMTVGQSVFIKGGSTYGTAAVCAYRHGAKTGKQFVCRNVEGGMRVWRVE